jgi:hypothetical protein
VDVMGEQLARLTARRHGGGRPAPAPAVPRAGRQGAADGAAPWAAAEPRPYFFRLQQRIAAGGWRWAGTLTCPSFAPFLRPLGQGSHIHTHTPTPAQGSHTHTRIRLPSSRRVEDRGVGPVAPAVARPCPPNAHAAGAAWGAACRPGGPGHCPQVGFRVS